jgi:GNAT superfamily N-acetyltransferase
MVSNYPLTKANRIRIARAFQHVPRVDLSIDCVIEEQMGQAFVDSLDNPSVIMLQVGSFLYLAGDARSAVGIEMIQGLPPGSFIMPSTPGWAEMIVEQMGERLVTLDRYSFSNENLNRGHIDKLCAESPYNQQIKPIDAVIARRFWGQEHFIDLSTYQSPDDFLERGIGYCLQEREEVIGAAYATLVCSRGIEVSIYVMPAYRRQGIATGLASHLLSWCLQKGLDANWDAANPESCKLALKLGYKYTGSYTAYYLSE